MNFFREEKKEGKNKKDWRLSVYVLIKDVALGIAVLFGLRLMQILWQKSILQLVVEGWTSDLKAIYLSVILIAVIVATSFWLKGKKNKLSSKQYNHRVYKEEQKRYWQNIMNS